MCRRKSSKKELQELLWGSRLRPKKKIKTHQSFKSNIIQLTHKSTSEGSNYCPAAQRYQLIPLRHIGFYYSGKVLNFRTMTYEENELQKVRFENSERQRFRTYDRGISAIVTRLKARKGTSNGFEPTRTRCCAANIRLPQWLITTLLFLRLSSPYMGR